MGGAVIGESARELERIEGDCHAVIDGPYADIAIAFLDASYRVTTSPHKGEARHFTIVTESGPIHDAAWSYETPKHGVVAIAGHLALYPEKATVERV